MTASKLHPAGGVGTGARPGLLYRWGMLVARRKRVVFAVWVVLLIAGLAFLRQFSSALPRDGEPHDERWLPEPCGPYLGKNICQAGIRT